MTDEKYLFITDVREKKRTANSAFNRRSHAGKGGKVTFLSDYLTYKERKAMNGEVKSYRLNEPMKWDEFREMPDDIKISYVKLLRQRFRVSDTMIAKMLCVPQASFAREIKRLEIGLGKNNYLVNQDKEGFLKWWHGVPPETAVEPPVEVPVAEPVPECVCEPVPDLKLKKEEAFPCSGRLTFYGSAEDALRTAAVLLGGANVRIEISWDAERGCPDD